MQICLLSNVASSVISAFSTLLTGHPVSAPFANSWNFSLVIPGIFAFNTSADWVMVGVPQTSKCDSRGDLQAVGRETCPLKAEGQRHRITAGMRGGNQFFGIGAYAFLKTGSCRNTASC